MVASERARRRGLPSTQRAARAVVVQSAAGLTLAASFAGCVTELSLEGRSCPCTAGYVCCEGSCQPSCDTSGGRGGARSDSGGKGGSGNGGVTSAGQSGRGGGGAGAAAGSGESQAGQSSGGSATAEAGATGDSGASGAAGSPASGWHAIGDASLGEFLVTGNGFDFEVAGDGTLLLAFKGCRSCGASPPASLTPTLLRWTGNAWLPIDTDTLPASATDPALALASDGTEHLLSEGQLWARVADGWTAVAPSLVGRGLTADPNLVVDAADNFYVTLFDTGAQQVSVFAFGGNGVWQAVGEPVPSEPNGIRLAVAGQRLCLAHGVASVPAIEHLQVECFDGSWQNVGKFPGDSAELVLDPPSRAFLALVPTTRADVRVTTTNDTAWSDLDPLLTEVMPALGVTSGGELWAAYRVELTYVNVARSESGSWSELPYAFGITPFTASSVPVLRLFAAASGTVPYVAFQTGQRLRVITTD